MVALVAPMSLFAETRSQQRTDMLALAADLQRALGRDRVEISGVPTAQNRRTSTAVPRRNSRRQATEDSQTGIIASMNRERAAYGLPPLRANWQLTAAANDRIDDLFAKHYFNHVSPDGIQPFIWAQRRGYRYRAIGENLADGYPTAQAVVDGWMNSPGHRANILGRYFDEVGIAVAPGSPVGSYSGPTVVALYATR
jgi:uncharacterized protein YkwD